MIISLEIATQMTSDLAFVYIRCYNVHFLATNFIPIKTESLYDSSVVNFWDAIMVKSSGFSEFKIQQDKFNTLSSKASYTNLLLC